MTGSSIRSAGVVGAGLVGSAWAIVFARAGVTVRAFDASEDIRRTTAARIRASLEDMAKAGLVDGVDAICSRVTVVDDLRAAVADVDYVQESVFERIPEKREVSEAIGALIRDDAVVGSSSSGIPASAFTEHAPRRERFLIAHPVNPPHLVPLVELVPAPWTDPAILPWLRAVMQAVGQAPIVVNREIEGFILNRLQGALLKEAWALFEEGYANAADIDLTVSQGLGLRWSFMGPFETIDLNAPGGVDDYARRLGPLYQSIAQSRSNPRPWSPELIERARSERRAALAQEKLPERSAWRDRRLMALVAHRRSQPSE
jgi:L-gulonate 3-dehydrogenase